MEVNGPRLAGAIEEVRLSMIDSGDIGNLSSEALAKRLMDALPPGPREPGAGSDPELSAAAVILSELKKAGETGGTVRVLAFVAGRYGYVLAAED